jgi:hypothetical protein
MFDWENFPTIKVVLAVNTLRAAIEDYKKKG